MTLCGPVVWIHNQAVYVGEGPGGTNNNPAQNNPAKSDNLHRDAASGPAASQKDSPQFSVGRTLLQPYGCHQSDN
jgi:hypothetical protein